MRIVLFGQSLVSDWNHGNAHFLRGIAWELSSRGNDVEVYEPADGWSRSNLVKDHGAEALSGFAEHYPGLRSAVYDEASLDLDRALQDADMVLVHEWNSHDLVRRIGEHRKRGGGYRLLFHDTHHRSATAPESMAAYALSNYDGVLAFGETVREIYLKRGWARRVWTWHEAADTRVFHPMPAERRAGDVVWVGNWGDGERTAGLEEFLLEPAAALKLKARAYGVRYPPEALAEFERSGIEYGGWIPNYDVPRVYAQYRATVHIPRRPYADALPGIPTIRPFEALACAVPLVSAPWDDVEGLFRPGTDFLVARNGAEMRTHLDSILCDGALAAELKINGLQTILSRHTCAHRVDELLSIYSELTETASGAREGAAFTY